MDRLLFCKYGWQNTKLLSYPYRIKEKQKKQSLVPCFFRISRQRSFYHPKSRHRSSPGACHGVP